MAETILNRAINEEIEPKDLLDWLSQPHYEDSKLAQLFAEYNCSRVDFVTFFLNFIHEEIGGALSEKKLENDDTTQSSGEINRSHSFPLDLSSEVDDSITNSTPKVTRVSSDSCVLNYMSPISPIYKTQNSFSTPKASKSSLCLGDFILNKHVSSKKKSSETKRRIKPTNLTQNKVNTFHKSENSFNFNKYETNDFPSERNFLVEEKLRILSRNSIQNLTGNPKRVSQLFSGEIKADLHSVSYKKQIEVIVAIYVRLLDNSFVLNLTSEVHFLISLLLKKQFYSTEWGIDVLSDNTTASSLFNSIHNVIFFASKSLENLAKVLRNCDNSTIRLLLENERLRDFAPGLIEHLQKVCKPERTIEAVTSQTNICFNSDTDNRQNFPNDFSFHAFRKQRDLFYEILRVWEVYHLAPGFNYIVSLGGKIRSLLSLSNEPTNFIHLARLFKAQLLNTCQNSDSGDLLTSLDVDTQKLNKLKSRCVTKKPSQGLNALPVFGENEEFYKEFILVGANVTFNRHLSDILIEEISELNESNFGCNAIEEDFAETDVDVVTKKSYYTCLKNLRTLAKFLGFVESLPYKSEIINYSEHLLTTHLKIRQQIRTNFDVKTILDDSIKRKSVILCVPWLIKYLSMLDYVTLRLPYYTEVHTSLFWIYRNFNWGPDPNVFLVKCCLGWLFELPHFPDNNYLHFCSTSPMRSPEATKLCLDGLKIVDQNILYFCCPYLDEIKRLLSASSVTPSVSMKHITPVTALQSPEQVARKKIEQQLEEAFFNGQPVSLRKTVEFISERVASTCVKYLCHTLVPIHKKLAVEKFQASVHFNPEKNISNQKTDLKTKANQMACICLDELRKVCDEEIRSICEHKISGAIESLVSLDTLPQTKQVCVGITKQMCRERVTQWIDSHVTLSIFIKDFNDEIQKIVDSKKHRKPIFMLPPGGTSAKHNEMTTSPAHLLEKYRILSVEVIEGKQISKDTLTDLLDDTSKSISERGDFNQCILATICTQLLDIVILLLALDWPTVSNDLLSKSCGIWKLYYNGCDDLFKLLLCPRNVKIFSKSNDKKGSWNAFATFCAYLIKNNLLSSDVFESQCTGMFSTNWDQETLKFITDFYKTFGILYRDYAGRTSEVTFLLEFFSDYCEDLC